jgi:hypothetical protein
MQHQRPVQDLRKEGAPRRFTLEIKLSNSKISVNFKDGHGPGVPKQDVILAQLKINKVETSPI